MSGVKFYSEFDIACSWELGEIIEKINKNAIETEWTINNLIEFYNILKYIQIERFADYLEQQTGIDSNIFYKKIQQKIGRFIGMYRSKFVDLYDEIDFTDTEDFLEIIEMYSIYKVICVEDFRALFDKEHVHVYFVLKFKKLTEYFECVIKEKILSNSDNAETIISKYLGESNLYLPPSLTEDEILTLIDYYIDSPRVNINVLRKIIVFPPGKGINIPDKIKLHAKRKEKDEVEKIFNDRMGIKSSVSISYLTDQEEAIQINKNGSISEIKVSRKWIEENLDYPTLWNNFIYLFGFVDDKFRVTIVSKTNDMSAFESIMNPTGNHLYKESIAFGIREMSAKVVMYSYVRVLNVLNVRIEDMIEWFFCEYLRSEFSISDFIIKMPTEGSSYFEKCRTILPEIDRIFKQYNALIEDGKIDQELIQMSSSSVKNKDIKSSITRKYVYPLEEWYQTASYLLLSDQSGIFYLPKKKEKFKNFLDLIIRDDVMINDFQEHQRQGIQWLFDNGLIYENKDRFVKIMDIKIIYILKELYYEDVLNYWHYPGNIRKVIDNMETKKVVAFESTLLSKNEQDYLDYYLNKSKFTNGHDIRNKYLHGTNVNDENQYEEDYYLILKLLVIIIIKINDDLCIKEDYISIP